MVPFQEKARGVACGENQDPSAMKNHSSTDLPDYLLSAYNRD
jgi:hypothetical protein